MRAPDYSFIRSCLCLYCVRDTVRCDIWTFPTFGCYLKSQRAFVQWNSFFWKLHDVCRFTFNLMRCCPWTTSLSARSKCAGLDAAPPELALISSLWDQRRKRTVETSVARPQKNGDSHYGGSWGPDCYFLPLLTSDGRRMKAKISPESRQGGIDCRCQIDQSVAE